MASSPQTNVSAASFPDRNRTKFEQYLGERIRARRIELGRSQDQLANALGISYQQLQKYESGTNRISASRLLQVADALNLTVADFYEGYLHQHKNENNLVSPAEPMNGAHQRSAIEIARQFGHIDDPRVRNAMASLVRAIVDRQAS